MPAVILKQGGEYMLESLMDWIKQIIYLLIFLTLFMELLPQKTYGKYVRFFAGLVFVASLISPVISLVSGGDWQSRLEQTVQEELQAFEEAGRVDDVDLEEMEETQSRMYTDFAEEMETSDEGSSGVP